MMRVDVYYLPDYQPYARLLDIQHRLHALRVSRRIHDTVLVLEHAPVITIGRTPQAERHVMASQAMLTRQGIKVCVTDRGGDVTYHGPGQITVYYIIGLADHDIHHFVHLLEQSVITLLADYGIAGRVDPQYPGVWVEDAKICALGVAVKKWVSFHGIALNVCPDLTHFQHIVPCGIQHKGVTSFQRCGSETPSVRADDINAIKRAYIRHFATVFQRNVHEASLETLWRLATMSETDDLSEYV